MFVSANKVEQPIAAEGMIKAKEEKKDSAIKSIEEEERNYIEADASDANEI